MSEEHDAALVSQTCDGVHGLKETGKMAEEYRFFRLKWADCRKSSACVPENGSI